MTKTTTMTITRKSILDEVAKSTAYLGAKRDDYERLSTTDANDEILIRFWREAVAETAVEMGPAAEFTLIESPDEAVAVSLAPSIDPALAESLVRGSIIDRVLARWLALSGVENPAAGTASGPSSAILPSQCAFTHPLSPF